MDPDDRIDQGIYHFHNYLDVNLEKVINTVKATGKITLAIAISETECLELQIVRKPMPRRTKK